MNRLPKWLKWRIAYWLDRRREDICWGELVSWALGDRGFCDVFIQRCRANNLGTPWAYCGKCEKTGRYRQEAPE